MSDKTKRAINKGRRKAGLKPIKFGKPKVDNRHKGQPKSMMKLRRKNIKCELCGLKTVGARDAWFQDFTSQKHICSRCVKKIRSKKS